MTAEAAGAIEVFLPPTGGDDHLAPFIAHHYDNAQSEIVLKSESFQLVFDKNSQQELIELADGLHVPRYSSPQSIYTLIEM